MPVLCITGYFPLSITVYQILSWRSYNKRMYKLVLNKKKFTITQITNKTITGLNHMCIRNRNCLPFASTWVHPRVFSCFFFFFVGSMLLALLCFDVIDLCCCLVLFVVALFPFVFVQPSSAHTFLYLWILHSWLPLQFSQAFIWLLSNLSIIHNSIPKSFSTELW